MLINCVFKRINPVCRNEFVQIAIIFPKGYPVMIKASAGGGGKGMRIAWNDKETRYVMESISMCDMFVWECSEWTLFLKGRYFLKIRYFRRSVPLLFWRSVTSEAVLLMKVCYFRWFVTFEGLLLSMVCYFWRSVSYEGLLLSKVRYFEGTLLSKGRYFEGTLLSKGRYLRRDVTFEGTLLSKVPYILSKGRYFRINFLISKTVISKVCYS